MIHRFGANLFIEIERFESNLARNHPRFGANLFFEINLKAFGGKDSFILIQLSQETILGAGANLFIEIIEIKRV